MKALVRIGKDKGKIVEISQWCNDWFSATVEDKAKIFSPSALVFTHEGMKEILAHKNNGMLIGYFRPSESKFQRMTDGEIFILTFKRR
jgi:hypothetical protein